MSKPSFTQKPRALRAARDTRTSESDSRCGGVLQAAGEVAVAARSMLQRIILHELTGAERLLVLLWYAERMSPVEIAIALDLTESQAVSMHDRIVARLRESLVAA